jgi:two-component system cell cycle sensor histidine kinase/response regulator CckA
MSTDHPLLGGFMWHGTLGRRSINASSPPKVLMSQRVMYIDDEAALVQVFTRMLQRLGHAAEGFTDADAAIQAFRADPARFDLVVTDYSMLGMSGLEVARELRVVRPDVCIILVSGYLDDALVASSREAGIHHVVYKANTVKELCESVHRLLTNVS